MLSARSFRFAFHVVRLHGASLTTAALTSIVRGRARFSVLFRAAALRILVAQAPLAITCGLPYVQRRALVRKYFDV